MRKLSPKELIENIPNIQLVFLPHGWFNYISDDKSVFDSLYEWMLDEGGVPALYKKNLHNRTYVGEKFYNKLLAAEKKRLKKKHKLKPEELIEAVSWSDINSGPKTLIGDCAISGDCIIVVPESSKDILAKYSFEIFKNENKKSANKIKNKAAGTTFYQWLISQIERPDRVGDSARDVKADNDFPVDAQHYQEIEMYLSKLGAHFANIESLRQGWFEYSLQYPDRIKPYAWCDECSSKFETQNTNFTYCEETLDMYILCETCTTKYMGFHELIITPLLQISREMLDDLIKYYELSEHAIKEIIEKLKLWGIFPINEAGTIYFIKSTTNHEIKIGFTSGDVTKRLSTLQTSHPYKLELLATISGNTKFEKSLHRKFQQYRLKGEWFQPHPDIIAYVSDLK